MNLFTAQLCGDQHHLPFHIQLGTRLSLIYWLVQNHQQLEIALSHNSNVVSASSPLIKTKITVTPDERSGIEDKVKHLKLYQPKLTK